MLPQVADHPEVGSEWLTENAPVNASVPECLKTCGYAGWLAFGVLPEVHLDLVPGAVVVLT